MSHVVTGPFVTLNCIGPAQQPAKFSPSYVVGCVEKPVSYLWTLAMSSQLTPNAFAARSYSG